MKLENQLNNIDIENILTIRAFEESLLELFKNGHIGGTVHTCVGQEINPVVISKFTKEGDYFLSNHRGHGHFLAFNDFNHEKMFKEILGRNDGCSKGIGGSQHLASTNFLSNGIQEGMTPVATGLSYGLKFRKINEETNSSNCVFVFIAVGTPMGDDGSADLQYVLAVAKSIGETMQKRLVVVDKSTVPIGTADKVKATIRKELDHRGISIEFEVV